MEALAVDDPSRILCEVWDYLSKDRHNLPAIILTHRRTTGAYVKNKHTIYIRQDSWNKMCLAEKRLIVIHEAIHAKGIPHMPGFRTSADALSRVVYDRIWGQDMEMVKFEAMLNQTIDKIRKK